MYKTKIIISIELLRRKDEMIFRDAVARGAKYNLSNRRKYNRHCVVLHYKYYVVFSPGC